ncbi:ATPase [Emydomyces testavorans]|uniref:ATPase n=1 Tax=Emydomyces testavorans TaxID=2070801 RepID=A0AAF0DIQ3_9EURO|nr:ATPase [Emydomyces testavorans]
MPAAVRPYCRILADSALSAPSRVRSCSVAARRASENASATRLNQPLHQTRFSSARAQSGQCGGFVSSSRRGRRLNNGVKCGVEARRMASTSVAVGVQDKALTTTYGPMQEYDARVQAERLRDDDYQRAIIQHLQNLHEVLREYDPPEVAHPSLAKVHSPHRTSLFDALFRRSSKPSGLITQIPENMPKGLYMHGDVGCGKTMLMDLFYDTLPPNIDSKTRIHFHNFMQDVHKRLHMARMRHGNDFDGVPLVAAEIAQQASVLCFDEFQCTDVADAMILRRLLESLMSHGVVLVTTSNRHPDELYKNGIQRQSFIPCIQLLKNTLTVLNLNSSIDYRRIPRPPSGVYHHPLGLQADRHADKWFEYLGDFKNDPPHRAVHQVWGRDVVVPQASGNAARFTFNDLIGRATGAADYLELMRNYNAFIITDVPGMTLHHRDLARRFITFIDAVYESRAKLVLTTAVPLKNLFISPTELKDSISHHPTHSAANSKPISTSPTTSSSTSTTTSTTTEAMDDTMRMLMDDLGLSMSELKSSSIFSGDEERFAFARALSRLAEMESREWVERGMGVGMDARAGLEEKQAWNKMRSRWTEDKM